jgi:hypothetical protein
MPKQIKFSWNAVSFKASLPLLLLVKLSAQAMRGYNAKSSESSMSPKAYTKRLKQPVSKENLEYFEDLEDLAL